jgi:hypothetical protein
VCSGCSDAVGAVGAVSAVCAVCAVGTVCAVGAVGAAGQPLLGSTGHMEQAAISLGGCFTQCSNGLGQCSAVQCSAVQCSAEQCSAHWHMGGNRCTLLLLKILVFCLYWLIII